MSDHVDLPFRAEYAKSGRAGCKMCSLTIDKESLRLAIMIQSHHFDGKVPNWFHFNCFWKRAKCTKTEDIHGFSNLRWDDQEKIKTAMSGKGSLADKSSGGKPIDHAYKDYVVEYAKSNRSTCRGCESKIDKDCLRLSHKEFDSDRAKMFGPQDMWYHLDCFLKKRDLLGFTEAMDPTNIPGFKDLRAESKEEVLTKLGKGDKRKRKAETFLEGGKAKKSKEDVDEEDALRKQSELVWKLRDQLQKSVSVDALKGLLEYNNQGLAAGESKLLDAVSDAMAFGALKPCPECQGQFRLSGSANGYRCTGNITEWTKCQNFVTKPERKSFKVPKEYHDVPFLKSYKYVERQRLFPKVPESSNDKSKNLGPLTGLKVGLMGKIGIKQAEATKIIEEMGGSVLKRKTDKSAVLIITNQRELQSGGKYFNSYKLSGIPVVSEEFLNDIKNIGDEDLVTIIKRHIISDWPSDPAAKIKQASLAKEFEAGHKERVAEVMFKKHVSSTAKMTVKGGAAVDPDSKLEKKAHVLQGYGKNEIYNAVLGLVDISSGTNSFYKLQVLEADKGSKWWLFRAWGRVGTTIGGNKLEVFASKNSAVDAFTALYLEKTGNEWELRDQFEKVPNRFYPLDIDYGTEQESQVRALDSSAGSKSKLSIEVQNLIRLIFDIERMKQDMLEFEIDLKKMPLGKLSKKQIEGAYKILTELQELLDKKGSQSTSQLTDASNRFYTLIPHDFGLQKPPLLDSIEMIKNKSEMLDNLLEIEIAYNILKAGSDLDPDKDILDSHYEKLRTNLKVLDKKSEEFKRISEYVKNTHASTHDNYDLEIMDVFIVDRHGESKVYRPFKDLHNRMLLWHGSRLTNFVGILSQGLRIAPPEAPVSGYMFGKGIYFADMVSKSANYCMTSKKNNIGLMLLSEVALGNMYELTNAEYVEKLPKGKHSTKGLGRTAPNPECNYVGDDGVIIPMGGMINTDVKKATLLYNEYIVYDVGQVNLKYLLKMKFNYRKRR